MIQSPSNKRGTRKLSNERSKRPWTSRAEPGHGELGQARPKLGQGPSSSPARPSSPQLGLVRLFSPRMFWFFRRSFEVPFRPFQDRFLNVSDTLLPHEGET